MIPRQFQIFIAILLVALFGAGIYMFQLKARDERNLQRASDARPVTAPVAGPKATVRLSIAYDDDGVIVRRDAAAALPDDADGRAREVLRALIAEYLQKPSPHPLAEGSDVRAVYFAGNGLCVVDLNAAFAEGHRSGILVEQFSVATLVATLADNVPGIRRVKFLVDGKDRETLAGHADLSAVYDVEAVRQALREMAK